MRSCILDGFDLPNIVVYEDGRVYDTLKEKYIGKPTDAHAVCSGYGGLIVHDFSRGKLLGMCFRAPWMNGIKCVNLHEIGLSRYFATEDGKIFGTRNMDYVSPHYTHDGYQIVNLFADNGDYQPWRVHRLIASAFIPNPEGKDTVNHRNKIKDDNKVRNLEWAWMRENIDHRRRNGGGVSDEKIREICRYLEAGLSQTQAAAKAGVKRHTVKDLQYGSYYHITKDFNIPRYKSQKRAPIKFRTGEDTHIGQNRRVHQILSDSGSTTSSS